MKPFGKNRDDWISFEGRINRFELWAVGYIYNIGMAMFLAMSYYVLGIIGLVLFLLIALVFTVSVMTRRLHDIGLSGRWVPLFFNPFGLLILILKRGEPRVNKFGAPPPDLHFPRKDFRKNEPEKWTDLPPGR